MTTIEMLDALDELHQQLILLGADKQALIDQVLTPEIRRKLDEIEDEFSDKSGAVLEKISDLENAIKQDVIAEGATVKGKYMMAVFTKGRVSWDTKALDGYAAAHPEVAQFRKEGAPSVSIRKAAANDLLQISHR